MVRRLVLYFCLPVALGAAVWVGVPRLNFTGQRAGVILDSLDGVYVYNNGPVSAVHGRNVTEDGYNIGLKYQCVEFVKRYYLYRYGHRMPDSYGHAKDFFDTSLPSGRFNKKRELFQFKNGQSPPPQKGDMVVFRATLFNPYGHVAIVAGMDGHTVEIIQQNPGRRNATRRAIRVTEERNGYRIHDKRIVGFLRIHPLQLEDNKERLKI